MPIRLIPPRTNPDGSQFSPYWYARGTHVGIFVDRSTKTPEKRVAKIQIKKWERDIERGEYADPRNPVPVVAQSSGPVTFVDAALAYMKAGGERMFLSPIIEEWPHMALADIGQIALDIAAEKLYPKHSAATKNRQFYTPVSAVLRRAGIKLDIKRPSGWRGKKSTSWLEPEQAFALFKAADKNPEFGVFVRVLCYTGMRLSECLNIKLAQVNLERRLIYLPETKNGEARTAHLPPVLVAALASHPRGLKRHQQEKLFRYHASGRLRELLKNAMTAAGLHFPRRQGGFHLFCHTYATWMRRYGGLDNFGLSRTDRWKDPRSAERYLHTEVNSEARRADLLPTAKKVKR